MRTGESASPPVPWRAVRALLREDRSRLEELIARTEGAEAGLIYPAYLCVWLHRVSRYWYCRGWEGFARFFWQLNLLLTGANISPRAEIGGGLVIPHPVGVTIDGVVGRNLLVSALCVIHGDLDDDDATPVVGDDVTLSPHCVVFGHVRIGDRAHLEPGCFVDRDVPAGVTLRAPRLRLQRVGVTLGEEA